MAAPPIADLASAFDLMEVSDESLSPWAPVYQARSRDGRKVVVKRTAANAQRAAAMSRWTSVLVDAGLPVVAPVDLGPANPQQLGEDWWVAYPYVDGRPYEMSDAMAAGDLLGRLHSTPVVPAVLDELRPYEWPDSSRDDVDGDLVTLGAIVAEHMGDDAPSASAALHRLADHWWARSLPLLRTADEAMPLPRTGVSSDYKANNLVFNQSGRPTLVDPDNGGLEPRLFDLAMAVVLFHSECPTAPGRLFTAQEWHSFASAYLRCVDLTARERELWPAALEHMLWEEGSWVLEDSESRAWADDRQGAFLRDLAMATPQRFPLPT